MKKLYILLFLIFILTACGGQKLGADLTPIDLQLKADKEDIIIDKEYKDKFNNDTIKYLYNSNVKVVDEKYHGLDEVLEMRTKNTQYYYKGKRGGDDVYTSKVYVGTPFYEKDNEWYYTETATTTKVEYEKQTKLSFLERIINFAYAFDTDYTFAGDGNIECSHDGSGQATWDIVHDTTDPVADCDYTAVTFGGTFTTIKSRQDISGNNTQIMRVFLPFDTTGIPDAATVSSSTIYIYPVWTFISDNDGDDYIAVINTSQATYESLTVNDYDNCGDAIDNPTEGSVQLDLSDVTDSAYNSMTLNATGRGWIDVASTTYFGLREGHDMIDSLTGDGSDGNGMNMRTSEQAGTSVDPYLEIEYSVPSVTTYVATSTAQTSASLYGFGNIGGESFIDAFFNYGTATTSGLSTTTPETLTASSTYYFDQTGLTTLTPYYYRAGLSTTTNYFYGDWGVVMPADVATSTWKGEQWDSGTYSSMEASDDDLIITMTGGGVEDMNADSYCSVTETNDYFWIERVVFEDIDNTTGEDGVDGYVDHTDHTTTVTPDDTPTITVYSGNDSVGSYTNCVLVWIDWDNDYSLTDETPTDLGCYTEPSSSHTGSISIPSDFATSTLMRVFLNYNADPSGPCTNVTYGEIEDYSIGNAISATTGTWTSTSTDLTAITSVDTSKVDCASTSPANTEISLYTGINSDEFVPPTSWDLATCGSTIPNATGDLSSNYLWSKVIATSTDGIANITFDWLTMGINLTAVAEGRRFFTSY